jgi:hypothetical protein
MGARLSTLTALDLERFEWDGYLVVRRAFARADGLAMEREWWRELTEAHGIRRDDPGSWRQLPGDLKAAKRDRLQARIATALVFCHPVMVHCAAPNRGAGPRFMRIKTQILTHEGRERRASRGSQSG